MSTRTADPSPVDARLHQPSVDPRLRQPSVNPLIQRLFATITEVSSLPTVALRIIEVADDPSTDATDLLEVIQGDAALAARVMRTANSSYFGSHEAVDLPRAVTLLGFQEVRNLAFSAHLAGLFRETSGYKSYDRHNLWNHLVGVGAVARHLARVSGKVAPQEAYLAGLLHDLGLILIDQYLHKPFCRVIDTLTEETPVCEVEAEVLGFDHTVFGQFVGQKWRLGDPVTAALRYHHAPGDCDGPHREMVYVVALANLFCHIKGRTSLGARQVQLRAAPLFSALGLGKPQVESTWEQLDTILAQADSADGPSAGR